MTAVDELIGDGRADLGVGQRELDGRRLVGAALEPLGSVTCPVRLPIDQIVEDNLVAVLGRVLRLDLPFDVAEGPANTHADLTALRERETGVHLHGELGDRERHDRVDHSVQLELLPEIESRFEVRRELVAHVARVSLRLLPLPARRERGRLEVEAPLVAHVVVEDAHLGGVSALDQRRLDCSDGLVEVKVVRVQR